MAEPEPTDALEDYRDDLLSLVRSDDEQFSQISFFESVSEILEDAGFFDEVEKGYLSIESAGIQIDGYAWNELEKTFEETLQENCLGFSRTLHHFTPFTSL